MTNVQDISQHGRTVTLDKPRVIWYGMEALAFIAERYGSVNAIQKIFSDTAAVEALTSDMIKAMVAFVYAGLMHEDETLTERKVLKMLGVSNIKDIFSECSMAFRGMIPQPEGEADSGDPTK